MLAGITLQQRQHHFAVKGDAMHTLPTGHQRVYARHQLRDELERVGPLRQLGQVVYAGHQSHKAVNFGVADVALDGALQIKPHLRLGQRQQLQGLKHLGTLVAAVLPGKLGLLVAKGTKKLVAARNQHAGATGGRCCARLCWAQGQNAGQHPRECQAV